MDGREACRLMRRNGVKSPIVMLDSRIRTSIPFSVLMQGPMIISESHFVLAFYWRAFGPSCVSTSRAKTPSFPSGHIPSSRARNLVEGESDKKVPDEKETSILKFLISGRPGCRPRYLARRSLEIQRANHTYVGNPRLPPAPEDRIDPSNAEILVTEPGVSPRPLTHSIRTGDTSLRFAGQ